MPEPKPKKRKKQLSMYFDDELLAMIDDLCEVFKQSPSAICRQGIVRWWHSEQAMIEQIKNKKAKNGQTESAT